MKVLIAGGSGFLGGILRRHLSDHQVTLLVRRPMLDATERQVLWDAKTEGEWQREVDGADGVINLCGRSVNCRYNAKNMADIYSSRLVPTRLIGEAIRRAENPPRVWLNASSATIYRHAEDREMDEAAGEIGKGFSVDVCQKWEAELFRPELPNTRRVALRTSMVMSKDPGGPFEAFANLARKGVGGPMAGGRQFVSWIHEDDFARAVAFLIDREDMDGPVNLASPNPLRNAEFMEVIRNGLGARLALPTPLLLLKMGALLMQTETELIVKSRRVVPGKLSAAGFDFKLSTWSEACRNLVAP